MNSRKGEPWINTKQLPPKGLDAIRDKLLHYTTFMFAVEQGTPSPRHYGAATCVAVHGAKYLLTAAHVWRALNGSGRSPNERTFALALGEDRLLVPVPRQSVEAKILCGTGPEEWGPDLALIKLPAVIAADIGLVKAFYDLGRSDRVPAAAPGWQPVFLWAILGAADEKTTSGPQAVAVLKINLFDSWVAETHHQGGFDYYDISFDPASRPGLPRSYGGVSGSGLWRVPVMESPEDAGWTGAVQLTGVAFYESHSPGRSTIRSHGQESLYLQLIGAPPVEKE